MRLFKEKNIGQLPGEENINLNNLQRYQNLLTEANSKLKEAQLQKSLLEKQLAAEKPLILAFSSSNNPGSNNDPLNAQLAQLNSQFD